MLLVSEIEPGRGSVMGCRRRGLDRDQPATREALQHRARAVDLVLEIFDPHARGAGVRDRIEHFALLRTAHRFDVRLGDHVRELGRPSRDAFRVVASRRSSTPSATKRAMVARTALGAPIRSSWRVVAARFSIVSIIARSTRVKAARANASGAAAIRYAVRDSTRATAGITLRYASAIETM